MRYLWNPFNKMSSFSVKLQIIDQEPQTDQTLQADPITNPSLFSTVFINPQSASSTDSVEPDPDTLTLETDVVEIPDNLEIPSTAGISNVLPATVNLQSSEPTTFDANRKLLKNSNPTSMALSNSSSASNQQELDFFYPTAFHKNSTPKHAIDTIQTVTQPLLTKTEFVVNAIEDMPLSPPNSTSGVSLEVLPGLASGNTKNYIQQPSLPSKSDSLSTTTITHEIHPTPDAFSKANSTVEISPITFYATQDIFQPHLGVTSSSNYLITESLSDTTTAAINAPQHSTLPISRTATFYLPRSFNCAHLTLSRSIYN